MFSKKSLKSRFSISSPSGRPGGVSLCKPFCYYLLLFCYCVFPSSPANPLLLSLLLCYCVFPSSPAKPLLLSLLLCYCVFPSSLAKSSLFFCYFLLLLCYCVFNPLLCLLPFGEAGRGFTLQTLLLFCHCVLTSYYVFLYAPSFASRIVLGSCTSTVCHIIGGT